jgi:beta-alanine degradation protein BauB
VADDLGPIADRVLYEDERIRVWEMVLPPGAASATHHHDHPYVIVQVAGDRMALRTESEGGGVPGYREADVVAGAVHVLPAGATETAINIGSLVYRDIEIELLG